MKDTHIHPDVRMQKWVKIFRYLIIFEFMNLEKFD